MKTIEITGREGRADYESKKTDKKLEGNEM